MKRKSKPMHGRYLRPLSRKHANMIRAFRKLPEGARYAIELLIFVMADKQKQARRKRPAARPRRRQAGGLS